MKVLGLVGSPRKGGNTDLLVSAVLYGAGASNHEIEKLFLYAVDISPCVLTAADAKKEPFNAYSKMA